MGLLDSVKDLFVKWKGKRKFSEIEDETTTNGHKRKRVNNYTLTPASKFQKSDITEIRSRQNYYKMNEEIRSTETRYVEFKKGGALFSNDALTQLIRKYGPAFLNSDGGVLLSGVTDNGIVKGLSISETNRRTINQIIKREVEGFRPKISEDLWSVSYVEVHGYREIKYVVEICFKKGSTDEIYENSINQVFVRRDGGVQGPLRPLDIRNLVISKYNETLKSRKKNNKKALPPIKEVCSKEEQVLKESLEKKVIKYIVID